MMYLYLIHLICITMKMKKEWMKRSWRKFLKSKRLKIYLICENHLLFSQLHNVKMIKVMKESKVFVLFVKSMSSLTKYWLILQTRLTLENDTDVLSILVFIQAKSILNTEDTLFKSIQDFSSKLSFWKIVWYKVKFHLQMKR